MSENPWKPRRPPADPRDVAPQPRRLSALRHEQEHSPRKLVRRPGASATWQVMACCLVVGLLVSAGWMLSGSSRGQAPGQVASPALGMFLALVVPDAQAGQSQVASAITTSKTRAENPRHKRRKARKRLSASDSRSSRSRPAPASTPAVAPTSSARRPLHKAPPSSRSKPDPKPDPKPYQEPVGEGGQVYDPEESDVIGPHGEVTGQRYPESSQP